MPETENEIDFEKALAELEQLVETMEKGELTLEESLVHFERGVTLTRACQKALAEAEQKVRILTRDNESAELAEFEADREDNVHKWGQILNLSPPTPAGLHEFYRTIGNLPGPGGSGPGALAAGGDGTA